MEYINTKNSDVSDLFKDLNLPQNVSKDTRKEIEDYYVEVRPHTRVNCVDSDQSIVF